MMKSRLALAALLTLAMASHAGATTLIGDTVNASIAGGGWAVTPGSAVVTNNPGPEFILSLAGTDLISVNIGDTTVRLVTLAADPFTVASGVTFNLTGLDFTGPPSIITGAGTIVSGMTGYNPSGTTFGPTSLSVNLGGTAWPRASSLEVFLTTTPVVTTVPERSTLALAGLGAFGLAVAGLRRRLG